VHLVEAAALESKLDLTSRYARLQKLPPRNDPMLLRRQGGEEAVRTREKDSPRITW